MHLGLVTPDHQPPGCGNQVMAQRLADGLRRNGIRVSVLSAGSLDSDPRHFDLIHALHSGKAGTQALQRAGRDRVPFTVTFTGTDIDLPVPDTPWREQLCAVLGAAVAAVVIRADMTAAVARWVPEAVGKVVVIPQGPVLPEPAGKRRPDWELDPEAFVFLLPAGLRAVKRPSFALEPLAQLWEEDRRVRWVVAGPTLEPAVADLFLAELRECPWARYLGEVPRAELVDLYSCADVVLNTSASEGMPNALLEAMALGRPVLASDVPGNRALIEPGVDGLLFTDEASFHASAGALMRDAILGRRLARQARQKIKQYYRPEVEIAAYFELFCRVAGNVAPAELSGVEQAHQGDWP